MSISWLNMTEDTGWQAVPGISAMNSAFDHVQHTGLFNMLCLLFLPFLMWLLRALESSGFKSSKLQRSSADTDMTAPQLSNSPQYFDALAEVPFDPDENLH